MKTTAKSDAQWQALLRKLRVERRSTSHDFEVAKKRMQAAYDAETEAEAAYGAWIKEHT